MDTMYFILFHLLINLCNGNEMNLIFPIDSNHNIDTKDINVCHGPSIISCELVLVNVKAFIGNITLPGGRLLERARKWTSGVITSYTYRGDEVEAIFVEKMGRVAGEAGEFALEPCNNFAGCHVWKKLAVEEFRDEIIYENEGDRRRIFRRESDTTTIVQYSVKIYYTRQFAEVTDDIDLLVSLIESETNQGYINSHIPLEMQIHCIEAAALDDIEDSLTMLYTFRDYKSSKTELRGSADAAALLVNSLSGGGIAFLNSIGSKSTFSVTRKDYATGYYTFGHELARNFGASHNREQYETHNGDAYGKLIEPEGSGYRTIMAYYALGHSSRLNYYSNPNVILPQTGTPTGSSVENNARILTANRFAMANIGNEESSCPPSWPNDFKWSAAGPVLDRCVQIYEGSEPWQHTWNDNYLCWNGDIDLGFSFSSHKNICGMRCTHIYEDADPHTWDDNFLCVPKESPLYFSWHQAGPISGQSCIKFKESADPHTWDDNYLCATSGIADPDSVQTGWPVWPDDFQWSNSGPVLDRCVQIHNWREPASSTWRDNYLCWKNGEGMSIIWSTDCDVSEGGYSDMRCTQIHEGADPYGWTNNHLCVPSDSPYYFSWSEAGPISSKKCIGWFEGADPHTWSDNYLCA